jgi:outer membrane beta-barrel protein
MQKTLIKLSLFSFFIVLLTTTNSSLARGSRIITSRAKTVMNKLYPRDGKLTLTVPFGLILNQTYIDSFTLGIDLAYYFNETWALHLEGTKSINTDKEIRTCLNHWYYDAQNIVKPNCWSESSGIKADAAIRGKAGASFSPAYPSIRELDWIFTASLSWNPIYGKQLAFLSFSNRFDLYFKAGLGATLSKFYEEQKTLKNGQPFRTNKFTKDPSEMTGCPPGMGVCPNTEDWEKFVGKAGRNPTSGDTTPTVTLSIGQRLHFLGHFNFTAEIRNYTLVLTQEGFESFTILWAGLGARI